MAQQIINTGEEPNDGTGEPLRSAFNAVNENFTEIYNAGPVGSNVVISGNTISVTGTNNNLVLSANGIGNVQFNSTLTPAVNAVFDIGSTTSQFRDIYASGYLYGNGRFLTGIAGGSGGGNSISNDATSVAIPTPGGNVVITIDGRGNVLVIQRQNIVANANLIPSANVTYDLGSANSAWKDLYLSNSTIFLGNTSIRSNATAFTFTTPTGGTLTLQGNGTVISYGNANVAAYLPTNTANIRGGNISATGNVTGQYIIGDGGFLSNVVATGNVAVSQLGNGTSVLRVDGSGGNIVSTVGGASNVQVITPEGVVVAGSISASGNITGNYFFGNASSMSGLPEAYSNAKVEAILESYTGNLLAGNAIIANSISAESISTSHGLTSMGTISAQGNVEAQGAIKAVGNIITEGVFIGNFQGNITGNITVPGSNTQVLFNGQGNAAAVAGFTYNADSNTVGVLGVVSAQGNVIGGNIVTNGRVSANLFVGNAAGLTSIPAANILGTVPVAATVADASQPNITSVGTLTALTVNGNIQATRLTVNNIQTDDSTILTIDDGLEVNGSFKSDSATVLTSIDAGSLTASGNIVANNISGNGAALTGIVAANIVGTVATAASVTDAAQPNITSVGTLTGLTVDGNISASRLTVNRINSDDSSILIIDDGLEVNGLLRSDSLTASGNIAAGYFIGNGSLLTGGYSNSDVAAYLPTYTGNLDSLTGNITTTGNISANFFVGNGSQLTGVIATDIGTLSSLSVTGNTVSGNLQSQGLISGQNISITGNIVGSLGSNLDGIAIGLTSAEAARFSTVSAIGNVTIDGITTAANISANGTISASGQITAASVNSIGNLFAGNINTALISATDIDAVSLNTSGNISATGNVSGSFFIGNGSLLTGVVSSYGDSNVAAYLPTYTGNLNSLQANVTTTANINANNVSVTNAIVSASLTTTGNAVIGGDLVVNGNTVQINVTELNVEDPIIGVGRGANNTPLTVDDGKARGIQLWYYDTAEEQAFIGWDTANSTLIAAANVSTTNETVSVNNYGNFVTGNITAASVTASGNIVTGSGTGGNISGANVISANTINTVTVSTTTLSAVGNAILGNAAVSGTVSVTGNVTANAYSGSGAGLTFIPAGNVVGTVALAESANIANTVTASNQSNITAVGTLTSLSVAGNITVDTDTLIVREDLNAVGIGGTPINKLTVIDTSNAVSSIQTVASFYSSAIANNELSVLTLGKDTNNRAALGYFYAGNASANNAMVLGFAGQPVPVLALSRGNLATFAGNVSIGSIAINHSGAEITGLSNITTAAISVSANLAAGNILTSGTVSAIGNINGNNLSVTDLVQSNRISVTANITAGNINSGGKISTTGTVETSGLTTQNITATANVNVTGNVTAANFIGNVVGSFSAPGSNTQILFNDSGLINADSGLVYDYIGNILTVGGNIATSNGGNLNLSGAANIVGNITVSTGNINGGNILGSFVGVSGNVSGGNIVTGGRVTATGNITGGNLVTTGQVSAASVVSTANISGGNLLTSGSVTATGAAVVGSVSTAGTISATGNITGGNVNSLGIISATGNVRGANINTNGQISAAGNIITSSYFVGNFVGNITGNISVAGSNTQLLFNNDGNVGAAPGLTYNSDTSMLMVVGDVSATGNVEGANLITAGSVSITGNAIVGNVNTASLSLSGNVLSAINTVNNITTTANISANNMSVTGTININGDLVATVDDATALAIALG
jgi:hypothetical protein